MRSAQHAKLPDEFRARDGRKKCRACLTVKAVSDFRKLYRNADGLNTRCRSCAIRIAQRRYDANAERARGYSRSWRLKNREKHRKYIRDYKKSANGRAVLLLVSCKRSARKKNLEFDLDSIDIVRRIESGRCEVTGLRFELDGGARNPWQPSIDRIDASRGYTRDNVRVVVWIYNAACNIWGEAPLKRLVQAMAASLAAGKAA